MPMVVLTQVRRAPGAGLLTTHYYSRYEFEVSQRVPKVIMCRHQQRRGLQVLFHATGREEAPGVPYLPYSTF